MASENSQRIVVVGASAAGLKAAARARRLLPATQITVLDERTFISYGACGLPYFLSGDIENLDKLRETSYGAVRDPEFFAAVKDLQVLTGIRAARIDLEHKQVEAVRLGGDERPVFPYDQLVIATGSGPRRVPGIEPGEACCFFHTPEEAKALRQGLQAGKIGSVVVVGGGFIGCELAAAFAELWGCEVCLLEAEPQLLPQLLDPDLADLVAGELRRNEVDVRCGMPVTCAATEDNRATVTAGPETSRETFTADRVVVAVGVEPRVTWAVESGLAAGPRGGLVVDEQLRTSAPDVFAAGDCIEVTSLVTGAPALVPLGSLANRQGRVVGDNLAGKGTRFGPVAGAACVKVFGWNVASSGISLAQAGRAGLQVRAAWGTFFDLAHYYPEHDQVFLKLVYEEGTRRLLGLQAVGGGETVKRVDVFTGLLQREGKLEDLLDLEFCYSPPYNAALDSLHGLGCVALNQEETGVPGLGPGSEPGDRFVLDVRAADEITEEFPSPPGAVNIPFAELRGRLNELPADRPLCIVCAVGVRSSEAARWLASQGLRDVVFLAGGMNMRVQR